MKIFNVLRKRITASAQPCQSAGSLPRHSLRMLLALSILLALLAACGDESSSSAPDPIGEISSSSNEELGSSSSVAEKNSSSSVSGKNSSSSVAESSSSDSVKTCTPDQEGLEQWYFFTKETYVCQNGVWVLQSSSEESFSGTPCEKDEEGYTVFISQEQVKYICQNEIWIPMSSSSVVQQSSSSKYYDMSRQFNAKLSYGEFTDPRDNHVYKTIRLYDIVVEDSLTFFAENLNFGKKISGGNQQGDSTKYCYDDDSWYCENGWGGLYTWATAMAFPAACDSVAMGSSLCLKEFVLPSGFAQPRNYIQHQGICPNGWHVMNRGEWNAAISESGIMNPSGYLSSEIWNGLLENPVGFSLLPAGLYDDENGEFSQIMKQAFHWVPGESFDEKANLYKGLFVRATDMDLQQDSENRFVKTAAFSIRCVKDY